MPLVPHDTSLLAVGGAKKADGKAIEASKDAYPLASVTASAPAEFVSLIAAPADSLPVQP
jgi:hypothetical protein